MGDVLGDGEFRYRVETHWGKLPTGLRLGDVAAIAVGPSDEVYLFNRSETPMVVLDRNGAFLLGRRGLRQPARTSHRPG
jgi:hypothetical protein